MNTGCLDCSDKARENNRDLDTNRINAKKIADEKKKAQAICSDELSGIFITDAQTAIAEHFRIIEIVSGLQ